MIQANKELEKRVAALVAAKRSKLHASLTMEEEEEAAIGPRASVARDVMGKMSMGLGSAAEDSIMAMGSIAMGSLSVGSAAVGFITDPKDGVGGQRWDKSMGSIMLSSRGSSFDATADPVTDVDDSFAWHYNPAARPYTSSRHAQPQLNYQLSQQVLWYPGTTGRLPTMHRPSTILTDPQVELEIT